MRQVSFREATLFWLKLGFISFGGPAGQIAIMHAELVERRRWISEKRFLHALNYCMVLPGPEAQQLATYIGWLLHRTWGGIVAGALFVLPSLVLMMLLSWIYVRFGQHETVAGIFQGIKPVVAAIVVHAAWRIGSRTLRNPVLFTVAGAAFLSVAVLAVPFPAVVIGAAVAGFVGGRAAPRFFATSAHRVSGTASRQPAVIDDDTPAAPHTAFRARRLAKVIAAGVVLWATPMAIATAALGWNHPLTQMGWFFTKAALLTFGGAYAVLPYVTQGAVVDYGWLAPAQMIDALALGESTPGPLIILVAFVGFVGAYTAAALGPEHLLLAGVVAAVLVTWFTFLPSFLFILAGAPFVEATQDDIQFTAPLAAITAAVVGVILNLALFFGRHVLWPQQLGGPFDWLALGIGVAAAVALFRFRAQVVHVVLAGGLIGLAVSLFA